MTNYTVADFQDRDDISLLTHRQEINMVTMHCNFEASDYGFLLVAIKDGEYTEVYGSEYAVPAANYSVEKLV